IVTSNVVARGRPFGRRAVLLTRSAVSSRPPTFRSSFGIIPYANSALLGSMKAPPELEGPAPVTDGTEPRASRRSFPPWTVATHPLPPRRSRAPGPGDPPAVRSGGAAARPRLGRPAGAPPAV